MYRMQNRKHHRAKESGALVELVRAFHSDGVSPKVLAKTFGVNINTLNDWIYYRTRVSADMEPKE